MTFYKNITSFSADTYKVGKPLGTHNPLLVTSQGTVRWLAPVILKSTCKLRVRYFPFDEQFCKLKFVSWTYSKSALALEPEDTEILQNYTGNFIYLSLRFSTSHIRSLFFRPLARMQITVDRRSGKMSACAITFAALSRRQTIYALTVFQAAEKAFFALIMICTLLWTFFYFQLKSSLT